MLEESYTAVHREAVGGRARQTDPAHYMIRAELCPSHPTRSSVLLDVYVHLLLTFQ